MHCCFFFQEPILKIWLQIVVKAGAINFDALHQLLYLYYVFSIVYDHMHACRRLALTCES